MKSRTKLIISTLILAFSLLFAANVGYTAITSGSMISGGNCKDCGSDHNCDFGNSNLACGYEYCQLLPVPPYCDADNYGQCNGTQPCVE